MPKMLTKEDFDDILEDAIELFGFTYVWDTVKIYKKELDFDEGVPDDDELDYDYFYGNDEKE